MPDSPVLQIADEHYRIQAFSVRTVILGVLVSKKFYRAIKRDCAPATFPSPYAPPSFHSILFGLPLIISGPWKRRFRPYRFLTRIAR